MANQHQSESKTIRRTASESSNGSISDYNSSHSTTAEPTFQAYSRTTNSNTKKPIKNDRSNTNNDIDPADYDSRGGSTSVGDNVDISKQQSKQPRTERARVPKSKVIANLPQFPISDQKDDISGREREDSLDSLNRVTFGQSDVIAYQFLIKQMSVRKWIEAVLSLSLDEDLWKALKDGVVLCQLFNKLYPTSIKTINTNTKNYSHKEMENIDNFLAACLKVQLVSQKSDMFLTTDLYDGRNIPSVFDFLQFFAEKTFENKATQVKYQQVEVADFGPKALQDAKKLENIGAWALHHGLIKDRNEVHSDNEHNDSSSGENNSGNYVAAERAKAVSKARQGLALEVTERKKKLAEAEKKKPTASANDYSSEKQSQIQRMVSLIDQSLKDRDPDNEERITPLHLAAEDGYDGVVTYLIKQGRDLNARDLNDDTPLHLAARAGKLSIVILLLKAGAQMNVKNKDLKYPLLVAVIGNHVDIVKELLKAGADPNVYDRNYNSPLHYAASRNYLNIVDALLDSGAHVDAVNKNRETALHRAAIGGHLEVVKSLVYASCNLNAQTTFSETALQLAVENEEWDIIKLLVDCGADVNIKRTDGWAPLYTAAWQGHLQAVKLFLANGADPYSKNQEGWSPLHIAAAEGHLGVVKTFVDEYNAKPDIQNENGTTPLFHAAASSCFDICKFLLEKGADPKLGRLDGWKPVHAAAYAQNLEIMKLLASAGAPINASNKESRNYSPLHILVSSQKEKPNLDFVKWLCTSGGDVNKIDGNGETALHLAAFWGHLEAVKILLDAGVSVKVKNRKGQTAQDVAALARRQSIVDLLSSVSGEKSTINGASDTSSTTASQTTRERSKTPPSKKQSPPQSTVNLNTTNNTTSSSSTTTVPPGSPSTANKSKSNPTPSSSTTTTTTKTKTPIQRISVKTQTQAPQQKKLVVKHQ